MEQWNRASGRGSGSPRTEDGYQAANVELKERFAAWCTNTGIDVDTDARGAPIHYKWGYLDSHLTRWARRELDEACLEFYPAKMMVEDDELNDTLADAKAFVTLDLEAVEAFMARFNSELRAEREVMIGGDRRS